MTTSLSVGSTNPSSSAAAFFEWQPILPAGQDSVKPMGVMASDLLEALAEVPEGPLRDALQRVCQDLGDGGATRTPGERTVALMEAHVLLGQALASATPHTAAVLKTAQEDVYVLIALAGGLVPRAAKPAATIERNLQAAIAELPAGSLKDILERVRLDVADGGATRSQGERAATLLKAQALLGHEIEQGSSAGEALLKAVFEDLLQLMKTLQAHKHKHRWMSAGL